MLATRQCVRPLVDPLLGRDILGTPVAYDATPDQDDDLQRQGDGGNGVVDPRERAIGRPHQQRQQRKSCSRETDDSCRIHVGDRRFVRYIPGPIRCQGRFGSDADQLIAL